MGNKITKQVKIPDQEMQAKKAYKKAVVEHVGNKDRMKEGGEWPSQGFGPENNPAHFIKPAEKTDFEHEAPGGPAHDMALGDWPNPVKKPTLKHVMAKGHLGHFSSDTAIRSGHHKLAPMPGPGEESEKHEKTESKAKEKMEDEA